MPYNMKKAGMKYGKGGSKKKYQKGMEMEKEQDQVSREAPMMPNFDRGPYQEPRDSIFTDGKYITTDPDTGLLKRGPDPMSPEDRIADMARKNIRTDRFNREEREDFDRFERDDAMPEPPPEFIRPGGREPMGPRQFPAMGRGGILAKGGANKGSKTFPDLTGDGKVTRADILKGRGVFKKGGSKGRHGIL
jgi:hypothetical protein